MSSLTLKKKKIGYFGSQDSYTYLVSVKRFGQGQKYISEPLISKALDDIVNDVVDLAVVPIENSTGGTVYDTIDVLISDRFAMSNIRIEEELHLRIVLNLLSKSVKPKIQKVYSHPFPIHYCREWIEKNLPGAQIIKIGNTSEAAKLASKEKYSAAIASKEAAETYGLNLIARNIGGKEPNITQFFVLSKPTLNFSKQKKQKTVVALSLEHKSGTLCAALKILAAAKINLTRIISRPLKGKVGEYRFLIEFEGTVDEPRVKKSLAKLEKQTTWINIISSYPSIKLR